MLCGLLFLAPGVSQASFVLRIAGAPAVAAIVSSAADAWHRQHPEVEVSVSRKSTGYGIAAVIRGDVPIGMVARELAAVETAMLAERVRIYAVAWVPVDSHRPDPGRSGHYTGHHLYLLVRKDAPAPARAFVSFLLSPQGQAIVRTAGYLPVRRVTNLL